MPKRVINGIKDDRRNPKPRSRCSGTAKLMRPATSVPVPDDGRERRGCPSRLNFGAALDGAVSPLLRWFQDEKIRAPRLL